MPTIDPNIALNAQAPQMANPLQTALQVAQYRLANTQGQANQQQLNANVASSNAFKQSTDSTTGVTDYNKYRAIMAGGDGAYNLPQINNNILDAQQKQQTLQTGQQSLAAAHAAVGGQIALSVLTNGGSPTDFVNGIQQAVQDGRLDPTSAMTSIAHAAPTFSDAGQFQNYLKTGLASLPPEIQASLSKPVLGSTNTGGGTQFTATNPLSGQVAPTGYLPNTATVAEQTARVPTFMNGQTGTIPAGSTMPSNLLPPGSAYVNGGGQPPPIPTVPMPAGMPTSNGQAAPLPGGPMPPGANPTPSASNTGPIAGRDATGFLPSAPPLGAVARADTTATSDAQMGQSLIAQADAQAPQLAALRNMRSDLQNFTSGPTSSSWLALKQLGSAYGVNSPEMQQSVASQEGFNKLAANLVSAQSQTMGVPTDSKVLVAQSGNPNAALSNLGNKEMINYLIGNAQYTQAKGQAWTAAQSTPTPPTYAQFQNQWNQVADPAVFHYANMQPAQRAAYLQSLSPAEQKTFAAKGNTALQNGWIAPGQ